MKRIRIFLASSITDLRLDRIEIGNFFRQLNDIYIESGIYFDLAMCEDYDNGVALEGKQIELDKLLCDSELVFFVFYKKVGEFTKHEFEIALENYKSCQRPKIITYFKCVGDANEANEDIQGFMNMLDTQLRHYYNIYQEIDTLKLGMFMQIKLMRLDNSELKIEDGRLMHGKTQIAETKNIPMFECNDKLNSLKNQLIEADKKFRSAKVALLKDGSDDNYLMFSDAATEKEKAEKELKDLENAILNAAEKMYEKTSYGKSLSQKQIQAYRHMERGEWDLALAILDTNDILSELSHNQGLSVVIRERIEINTGELLQRIEVLKAAGLDKNSIEEILSLYSKIYEVTLKHQLSLKPISEYASFLHSLNTDEEALKIIEKLSYLYADPDRAVSLEERAELLLLQGKIYNGLKKFDKTIALIQNDIDVPKRLCLQEGERVCALCGNILNILSNAFCYLKKYDDALTYQEEALKYYERACTYDPKKNKDRLAMINDNCGITFESLNEHDRALSYHKRAEGMYYELFLEDNSEKSKMDLARCYHNTAICYKGLKDFDKCEQYLLEAIKLREEIRQKNPSAIEPHLSGSYYSLGWLYKKEKYNPQRAKEALNASKSIRVLLRKRSMAYASELKHIYVMLFYDTYKVYTEQEKNNYQKEYATLLLSLPELTMTEREDLCEIGLDCVYEGAYEYKLVKRSNSDKSSYTDSECVSETDKMLKELEELLDQEYVYCLKELSDKELNDILSFMKRIVDIYVEYGNEQWHFDREKVLSIIKDTSNALGKTEEYYEYMAKLSN